MPKLQPHGFVPRSISHSYAFKTIKPVKERTNPY